MTDIELGSELQLWDESAQQVSSATVTEYRRESSTLKGQYRLLFHSSGDKVWITGDEIAKLQRPTATEGVEVEAREAADADDIAVKEEAESGVQVSRMIERAMEETIAEEGGREKKKKPGYREPKSSSRVVDWDYDALPVKIPIPPQLRKQLNDEHGLINQGKELVPLPRTPSASDIMDNWAREYATSGTSDALEVITMLKTLFQDELGNHLLYRLERLQYAEHLARNPGLSVDKCYGAEHLLRLFVILPWFLSNAPLDEEVVHTIKIVVANLMEYMRLNMGTFFSQEYEPANDAALQDAGLA